MSQLEAYLLSLLLETPVALLVAFLARRYMGEARVMLRWVVVASLLATTITHPVLWILNTSLTMLEPWPRLFVLEGAVFVVEGGVYFAVARMKPLTAWGASLAANVTSFGLGLVIYALIE